MPRIPEPNNDGRESLWGCALLAGCCFINVAAMALWGWWAMIVLGLVLLLMGLLFHPTNKKEGP